MTPVERARCRVHIQGAVQGVGFRPFVYRLATELGLNGWVNNSSQGVFIEVEGSPQSLAIFLRRLQDEKPPLAIIQHIHTTPLPPNGDTAFEIQASDDSGDKTTLILPDMATCSDCLRELLDPANRRYGYPFTNCTNCGPRFSIIEALPYDRPNTSMKHFVLCDQCREEYENPLDRRFHAQPNACHNCGPHLELWNGEGAVLATHHDALMAAVDAIRGGNIVAVKGLGGFHLMVDARNTAAIQSLRVRKRRDEKPLALMVPALAVAQAHCEVSDLEADLLTSPQAPIVLLRHRQPSAISEEVAPNNPYLGVMLPYTPLHHILMRELGFPVVATSGNLSDEPICTDEHEALQRLGDIADVFLVHNRPVVRHVDDSIVRVMGGRAMLMRRARGYAPLPVPLAESLPSALAVGAHLKNTVAVAVGNQVFTSQHIGDLETAPALEAFRRVAADLIRLYECSPEVIVCDAHPDLLSTQYAKERDLPRVEVQHHHAHVVACMAEHHLTMPVLGISWDGTGYGLDGTIWGGEFLRVSEDTLPFQRVAHFRTFRLPGGDTAIKEPRCSALGLLYEVHGDGLFSRDDLPLLAAFSTQELAVIRTMLQRELNAPYTSSAGRLFDAVAALVGLHYQLNFEGQAAMALEFAIGDRQIEEAYPFQIEPSGVIDWEPMLRQILADVESQTPVSAIAAKFHNMLVEVIVNIAHQQQVKAVALTGGCFQNQYLTERSINRLHAAGFDPYWHQQIPPNDGGIAFGQAASLAYFQG